MGYFPSLRKHPRVAISLSLIFILCGFYYTSIFHPLLAFLALLFALFRIIVDTPENISPQNEQPMDSPEKISPRNDGMKQQIEEIHQEKEDSHEENEDTHAENEEINEVELQESISDSDDESLIEISLPDGNHVESDSNLFFEEELKGESIWDFLPESIFKQTGLIELLKEINEEDNLIEIDISRGSIKCSNLGIMA